MSLLPVGFGASGDDYTIDDSLRFRSSATAYLSRTPASATNQKTWTWNGWVKRGDISGAAQQTLFGVGSGTTDNTFLQCTISTGNVLYIADYNATNLFLVTTQVFRDPSAWYMITVSVDTTQATASNRVKIYVNGSQVTSLSVTNYPSLNFDTAINSTAAFNIGRLNQASGIYYFDGYLTEINFIDGQALTPEDFGEYDANGTWKPIEYTGTYGTNGFYLPFTNPTEGSSVSADCLVIAGGGGGGQLNQGGGGGAGGYRTSTLSVSSSTSYAVTVGAGGASSTSGSASIFSTITSTGGGRGASTSAAASTGGSGGGGNYNPSEFSTGAAGNTPSTSPSQGNSGGNGAVAGGSYYYGGGGGGSSAVGTNASAGGAGVGGAGTASSITGSSVTYAGGGGGGSAGSYGGSGGAGGTGGGGTGGKATNGVAATVNTGSGGGGASDNGSSAGGAGGSGVVIISYSGAQVFTGGTVTTSGGNTIHTFTTSGILTTVFDDSSGNDNNWTGTNFNVSDSTATTYDLMKDTPSLVDANAGNFCTLNPLRPQLAAGVTYSNANLTVYLPTNASYYPHAFSNMGVSSGKFYWEVNISSNGPMIGIGDRSDTLRTNWFAYNYGSSNSVVYSWNGNLYYPGTIVSSWGATFTTGDVIGVALDMDSGTITFYKNNVSQGVARTGLSGEIFAGINIAGSESPTTSFNFGQRPFAYTPPTGFLKLNTFNLPDSTIEKGSDYFNTVLYTGDSTSNRNIPTGFAGGWTWIKNRNLANSHTLSDVVRGDGKTLFTNATNAEVDYGANGIDLVSDGFDVTHSATNNLFNVSGRTYVAWNWKANGSGVLNEVGDIDSTVSANTEAGFSVVSFTGTGANTTVGHGLGVAPEFMIIKSRTTAEPWLTYHGSLGGTQYLFLNQTSQANSNIAFFNNTNPTSTVFSLGNSAAGNTNTANYIAYCFAPVEGYSSFGSYTGNGSADGTFVYTGFRPAFVLVKQTNSSSFNWNLIDTSRSPFNTADDLLAPNANNAEVVSGFVDAVSNGFKCRNSSAYVNGSGSTYIYMAFAENPFKNSNAR